MTTLLSTNSNKNQRSTDIFICILFSITCILLITTITFGILWKRKCISPPRAYAVENGIIGYPVLLPNDDQYVQWTMLHLNDVYELLPLDQGEKGGLARVAHIRDLLIAENVLTYTFLAGDFLSPSGLSQAKVNGTPLHGKQMIETFNSLGLDFVTFGNHEFDLDENDLIERMNESRFTWISSNIFYPQTNRSFASSIPFKLLIIQQIRLLIIGLTIPTEESYVEIINETSLIPFVQQFLQTISYLKYDVLIALTHLDLAIDMKLTEHIPQIDLILGGHEHEDYFVLRGSKYTPIYKADANAFTVYIHRCVFNLNTKQFRVYSTLTKVTSQIAEQRKTADVAQYWFNLGVKGFEEMGFEVNKTVSCLPSGVELDGRSVSVRNSETLLTRYCCQSLLKSTQKYGITIALINSGGIRIDDVLLGRIIQYDILRVLPYHDQLYALSVPGQILSNVLSKGLSLKGNGMFLSYYGIATPDAGKTWIVNGLDISKSDQNYNIATNAYTKTNTELNHATVTILHKYNITETSSLIDYLSKIYPPC